MKEILFKAKQVENNEWVFGLLSQKHNRFYIEFDFYNERNPQYVRINPTTISQYTGLKDREGNKIFENDIVEVEVERDNENGYYDTYSWKEKIKYTVGNIIDIHTDFVFNLMTSGFYSKDCEIMGNKFDNPELLANAKQVEE